MKYALILVWSLGIILYSAFANSLPFLRHWLAAQQGIVLIGYCLFSAAPLCVSRLRRYARLLVLLAAILCGFILIAYCERSYAVCKGTPCGAFILVWQSVQHDGW